MALYCVTCSSVVISGNVMCQICGNGYISRLACGTCNRVVPSGYAVCPSCPAAPAPPPPAPPAHAWAHREIENPAVEMNIELARQPPITHVVPAPRFALPPGLSLERAIVPEVRMDAGRFGVKSAVVMNGHDADIMTRMNQAAMLLHALAAEMNGFQGIDGETRTVIRGCRDLASRLQEEVERRRGPA